jgi:hypothetical protein
LSPGDFKIVFDAYAADIYVDSQETPAVLRCANDLAADVQRVTGRLPAVKHTTNGLSTHAIIVGTVDKSGVIKALAASGKINISRIQGKWETFLIQIVPNPLPGVEAGLVIAGSDRRGAIYGMYDVSEKSGVSPWYWFADVRVQSQTALIVKNGLYTEGPPSVQYRGIFINDEDWGIRPWSEKVFAPEDRDGLGPKTYGMIFELMLRLRANYLWPARHPETRAFNRYDLNKVEADEYGIVMGSSHIVTIQVLRGHSSAGRIYQGRRPRKSF